MKHLCNLVIIISLLCLSVSVWAQQTDTTNLTQQEQLKRFLYQNSLMPQERVHVMTDRSHYLSGDTIWMRAFLVDGLTKKPVHYSRFLYIELRDEADKLTFRAKLHERPEQADTVMRGYIPTDINLPTGIYTLVAYTQWMLNGEEALFFKRNLQIVNADDLSKSIITEPLMTTTGCDAYHRVDSVALQRADESVLVVHPTLHTDRNVYSSREKVTVRFQAPPNSSLAVAVTDNAATIIEQRAALHYDILSQPYWHNLDSIYAGKYRKPTYLNEISQEISGHLYSTLLRHPMKNALLLLSAPASHLFRTARTDDEGRFCFEDFDMPDSVTFTVRANADKSYSKGVVKIAPSPLPEVVHHLEARVKPVSRPVASTADSLSLDKMKRRAQFSNGMWEISLEEVAVAAQKRVHGEDATSRFADRKFGYKEIQEMAPGSLEDLLLHIPGVIIDVVDGKRVAKYRGKIVHFLLNDWEIAPYLTNGESEFEYLEAYCHIDCIEYLDIVNATYIGTQGTDFNSYAIRIKDNPTLSKKNTMGIKTFKPLGHQLPREFGQTDYSTTRSRLANPPGTDMRSTLYWNPALEVDSTGQASFSFWTNDNYNTIYTIRIEGVSEKGQLIDSFKRIKMK